MGDNDCNRIQNMIEPFLTNSLDVLSQEEFVAHIRGCRTCREELLEYQIIYSAVSDEDDGLTRTEEYEEELERRLSRVEINQRRRRLSRFYLFAAVAIVLTVVGVAIFLFF